MLWDLIDHSFWHASVQGIHASLVFAVLGFILGLLIGYLR